MNVLDKFDYSINSENSSNIPFKSIEVSQVDIPNIMNILPNYFTTFVSLITETHFFNDYINDVNVTFLTEKIFKVISVGQPFIVVSTSGYISMMKRIGFKTFDKWWDESYDNIYDDYERLDAIIKVVIDICKYDNNQLYNMYCDMIPILKHNQEVTKIIGSMRTDWIDYTLDDIINHVKANIK